MYAFRYSSPGGKIPLAGPRNGEKDNIKMVLKENGGRGQIWLDSG
jgi:hypothetical protein